MVRIGIPRRPGPVLSTTTLYPPPNTSSNVANKQLYGVQLYGPDAPHIRFAATRYATEARRLLQSLLPSSSTSQKNANTQRVDDMTNRALVYAAESRRLLSTAQALEAGRSFPPWVPPSDKPYFSCALNVITTELSVADAAVADQFVYYARQANGADARGNNRPEICEYECKRIIAAQVPDLADRYSDTESKRKVGRGLEKVQRMVEAEQRARLIQAAAGVRFRSGDDSLVSDTGVPIVPRYSRTDRREYTPPLTVAPEGIEGDADRSLPPLRLQK